MKRRNEILERSKGFAVRIIRLAQYLKKRKIFELASQLIRCGTSIGANIHEAQCSESRKDFIHKMSIALKESRETEYWIDIIIDSKIVPENRMAGLNAELEEITKMLMSIVKTSKKNL